MRKTLLLAGVAALMLTACSQQKQENATPVLTKSGLNPAQFETTIEGKETKLFTLTNQNGMAWDYVETTAEGKTVRGFIPHGALQLTDASLDL